MNDIIEKLRAPFDPAIVSWRVGSTNKKKWTEGKAKRGQPLCYVDARDVMQRLDDVVGPFEWQDDYTPMPNGTMCCRIALRHPVSGEWVWKANGAGATDMEGEKGAYSDAFKRAAVLWGIGQYLYGIRAPWVTLDDYWSIPDTELPALRRLLNGDAEPSSRGSRDEYARLEAALRGCKTIKALATVWNTNKDAIAALPAGHRKHLMDEKDRCKEALAAKEAA